MKIKKQVLSLLSISVLLFTLSIDSYASLSKGGRLVIYSQEEPTLLDPLFNNSESAKSVYNLIFSGLVSVNDNFEYTPDLAVAVPTIENKGVIVNNEGMVVTYKLKDLTFWHDGTPLTSEDVKFTWQCYTNPSISKEANKSLEGYNKITKIETPDERTVKIYFKEIYSEYNSLFRYILPKHGFKPRKLFNIDVKHPFNKKPIGSGPFKFVEWKAGKKLVLDTNPKYYKAKPIVDQVVYTYGEFNKNTANDIEKGKIHIIQPKSNDDFKNISSMIKNTENHIVPLLDIDQLAFNTESNIFKQVEVRKAFSLAINREKIAKGFTNIKSIWSDVHPYAPIYDPKTKEGSVIDLKMAQTLLDKAGWIIDSKDGIRKDKNKNEMSVKLVYTDSPVHKATISQLNELSNSLGIKLNTKVIHKKELDNVVINPSSYDILLYTKSAIVNPTDRIECFSNKSLPPKGKNYSRYYSNLAQDILSNPASFSNIQLQNDLSRILREEVPSVPLFEYVKTVAISKKLNNFRPNVIEGNTWNSSEWWIN